MKAANIEQLQQLEKYLKDNNLALNIALIDISPEETHSEAPTETINVDMSKSENTETIN